MKVLMAEYLEWQDHFKVGSHHYGDNFLKSGDELLWIPGYWHWLQLHKPKEVYEARYQLWKQGLCEVETGVHSYAPFYLLPYRDYPFFRSSFVGRYSPYFSLPYFPGVLKENGWDEVDVLWLTNVEFTSLKNIVKHKKLVHRMADQLSGFQGIPRSMLKLEEELIKESDVLIVTSGPLLERANKYRQDVLYLSNGVDYQHFSGFSGEEPADLAEIPGPRITYVGAIHHWFDAQLLTTVAARLKEYSFVLIGPEGGNITSLKSLPNVYYLGPRPYQSVPAYLRYSNVGIIPFVDNELTNAVNPIKLFEYMASGLPVVCTDLREARNLNSPALLAKGSERFAEAIVEAIQGGKDQQKFLDYARMHSWENNFMKIQAALGLK